MQIITLRSVRCSYGPTAHTEHASYNLAAGMICFHEVEIVVLKWPVLTGAELTGITYQQNRLRYFLRLTTGPLYGKSSQLQL